MLVALATVTSALLVVRPTVKPDTVLAMVRLLIGQLNALVNPVP